MQSLVPWSHLYEWVKQGSADLQGLPENIIASLPFSNLPHLANCIEDRFQSDVTFVHEPERKPWLVQLGTELRRIELEDLNEENRLRTLAARLAETEWQRTGHIEVVPYVDGTPAGTPRPADVLWIDKRLYVGDRPIPKVALAVSHALGRIFRRPDVADAIKLCFDRTAAYVTEYLEENFTLGEPALNKTDTGPSEGSLSESPALEDGDSKDNAAGDSVNVVAAITADTFVDDIPVFADADPSMTEYASERPAPIVARQEEARRRQIKETILERFVSLQGFHRDGDGRFFHPDGSSISKFDGSNLWVRRNLKGVPVRYYWPRDHCLDLEPIQIDADIWALINKFADSYALILSDPEGRPVEVTGTRVRALVSDGNLKVYPATYRVGYDRELVL